MALGLVLVGGILGGFLGLPLVTALVTRGLFAAWLTPLEVTASAPSPSPVRVGETVDLEVRLHHDGDGVVERIIGYLDLAGGLYEGFRPVSGDPPWQGVSTVAHRRRYEVAYPLAVGVEGQRFGLRLEAVEVGRWTGTVTYCPTVKRKLQCRSDEVEIMVEP